MPKMPLIFMTGITICFSLSALAQNASSKTSDDTANVRNEYAHERNLRLSNMSGKTRDGKKRISDDSVRDAGDSGAAKNGTGVFEDHHVSGASR